MTTPELAALRRIAEDACDTLGHDWEAQGNDLHANLTSPDGLLYIYMEGFAKGQAAILLPYLQTFDPGMLLKLLARIEALEVGVRDLIAECKELNESMILETSTNENADREASDIHYALWQARLGVATIEDSEQTR